VDDQIAGGKTHYVTLGAIPNVNGQVGKMTLSGHKTLAFCVRMPDIYWYLPKGEYYELFQELKTMKSGS
jgi:hypothetical protein